MRKVVSVIKQLIQDHTAVSGGTKFSACTYAQSLQLSLWDSMDCRPPDFSVHGILQARILECVALPSSRGYSWPRDQTCVFCSSYIAGKFFTTEPRGKSTKLSPRSNSRNHILGSQGSFLPTQGIACHSLWEGNSSIKVKIYQFAGNRENHLSQAAPSLSPLRHSLLEWPCHHVLLWVGGALSSLESSTTEIGWPEKTVTVVSTEGEREKSKPRKHSGHRYHPAGSFVILKLIFSLGLWVWPHSTCCKVLLKNWGIFGPRYQGNSFGLQLAAR